MAKGPKKPYVERSIMEKENDREITFEIIESLAVLSVNSKSSWTKELNMVSWNGSAAKYDIREWDPEHKKMSRGITLSADEADEIYKALAKKNIKDESRKSFQKLCEVDDEEESD